MSAWRGVAEFLAVVEHGSFTAAAESLGVSKSFVSKMLNDLEARVGAQLLTRTTRRLSLTAPGELFHERCRAMQDMLIEAERQVGQFQSRPVGRLRLGLSDTFGSDFMSSLVAEFSARHPEIVVEIVAYLREAEVVQETFDVVIRYGQLGDSSMKARMFGYLSYCLCAAPSYVETHGWPSSPHDLERFNCLSDHSGSFYFNDPEKRVAKIKVAGNWRSNSGVALRWAARRGLGLAQLPTSIVRNDLADGKLVAFDGEWSFYDKEVWACFAPGPLPAATRAFIDYLAASFSHSKLRPWTLSQLPPPGGSEG